MDLLVIGTYFIATVLAAVYFWCGCQNGSKIEKKKGEADEPIAFELRNLVSPTLTGWKLNLFCYFIQMKLLAPISYVVFTFMKRKSNMDLLHKHRIPDDFTFYPSVMPSKQQKEHQESDLDKFLQDGSDKNGVYVSIFDLVGAYRSKKTTPLQVVENALEAIEKSEKLDKKMRIFVQCNKEDALKMANESTKRYLNGKTLSVVDGIPIALKEDHDTIGYHIRSGTTFIGDEVAQTDCNLVAKLRELGCIILGMANMHELGYGITGNNPNKLHGTSRNPHNVDYHCGGSSSGSAAAVAAGICPMAIGRDGGGSVRIPSAVCGVVGIKATFGRITGQSSSSTVGTVSHSGPICNNVRDTALMYALISGPDVDFSPGLIQPEHVTLEGFDNCEDLSDIKIGVDWRYSEFCDAVPLKTFKQAVDYLNKRGAIVSSIDIPELEETRVAHLISIACEGFASLRNSHPNKDSYLNRETFIMVKAFDELSYPDYLLAQKQRTRSMKFMKDIFDRVDVVLTPAIGSTMTEIPDDSAVHGYLNTALIGKITRYSFLANLTGIPGVVVPFGYDDNQMPIGVQVMTSWWEEHVAFRVAHCLEQGLVKRKPKVFYNILNPS